jgi:hypothetical protein
MKLLVCVWLVATSTWNGQVRIFVAWIVYVRYLNVLLTKKLYVFGIHSHFAFIQSALLSLGPSWRKLAVIHPTFMLDICCILRERIVFILDGSRALCRARGKWHHHKLSNGFLFNTLLAPISELYHALGRLRPIPLALGPCKRAQ